MLPRNVQQGYSGLSDRDSSHDATATYAMPSCTTGGALKRTASCSSGRFLQTSWPFDGIERVEPSGEIAEEQQLPAVAGRRDDRRSNRTVGLERPLQAARVGAQRMHHAAGAADEHLPADHRRLRERGDVAVEAECPFQLQLRHLRGGQAGERGGSESRVVARRTPAVPDRRAASVERDRSVAAERRCRRRRVAAGLAEKSRPPPRARRGAADRRWSSSRRSPACAECASTVIALQRVDARRPAVGGTLVARGAAALIDRFAGRALGRRPLWPT